MAMHVTKALALGLAGAGALALGGCYNDGYGYGGVAVGAGSGYYGSGYGYDPYYGGGFGGYPSYGWFDGYYYPGNGYYVYDRSGRRLTMRDSDRRHWQGDRSRGRREARGWRGPGATPPPGAPRQRDGRWQGRRDGAAQIDPQGRPGGNPGMPGRERSWRGREGWAGRDAATPRGPGREGWAGRGNGVPQSGVTVPGARQRPEGWNRPRTVTPRPGGEGGASRFRQRGNRTQQP